jgi:hypothetical protein
MPKYFDATDELAIETTDHIELLRRRAPNAAPVRGRMKAHLTIWEPEDSADSSLPTLREFVKKRVDLDGLFLSYDWQGRLLTIDAAPLFELPSAYLDYKVSPGATFVTEDALEFARAHTQG